MSKFNIAIVLFIYISCISNNQDVFVPDIEEEILDHLSDTITSKCELPKPKEHMPPFNNPNKFVLQVYHFNIQYVAGGLQGIVPPERDPDGVLNLTEEQLQDQIIKESFEPLLDMFLAHPSLAADIEMQGLMLEIIQKRHPVVLEKLRKLVSHGQVEVISFHYSDQLFTAHSRFSMEQSITLNKEIFDSACIPISPVVFTQEGQFSEGMLELMKEGGQTIGVLKNGLFEYVHGKNKCEPLYTLRNQDVLVTCNIDTKDLSVLWYFVDDGELAMTGGKDPYLGKYMTYEKSAQEKIVKDLLDLEQKGYFVTTISDYVRRIKKMGIESKTLPFMIDGTWHPQNSQNLFAWMGRGGIWAESEADNEVLTTQEKARIAIEALLVILNWASKQGIDTKPFKGNIEQGIRHLLLSEVSDATGWNPWRGEVEYGIRHAKQAIEITNMVAKQIVSKMGQDYLLVDLMDGTVKATNNKDEQETWVSSEPPLLPLIYAPNMAVQLEWTKPNNQSYPKEIFRLNVKLIKKDPSASVFSITFPRTEEMLIYSPAMLEDEVAIHPLSKIKSENLNVGLANGLVGLGNNNFIIKDIRTFHISAFFPSGGVLFKDETLNSPGPFNFVFYYMRGVSAKDASELAMRINVKPKVILPQ